MDDTDGYRIALWDGPAVVSRAPGSEPLARGSFGYCHIFQSNPAARAGAQCFGTGLLIGTAFGIGGRNPVNVAKAGADAKDHGGNVKV